MSLYVGRLSIFFGASLASIAQAAGVSCSSDDIKANICPTPEPTHVVAMASCSSSELSKQLSAAKQLYAKSKTMTAIDGKGCNMCFTLTGQNNLFLTNFSVKGCTIYVDNTNKNVTLDHFQSMSATGTPKGSYPSPIASNAASIVLMGASDTLQYSTVTGGALSGISVGGKTNRILRNTLTGVNTGNQNQGPDIEDFPDSNRTDMAGIFDFGNQNLIAYNSISGWGRWGIHMVGYGGSKALGTAGLGLGKSLIYGNTLNGKMPDGTNGIKASDSGGIYAGWMDGKSTQVLANTITNMTPPMGYHKNRNGTSGYVNYGAGVYFDYESTGFYAQGNKITSSIHGNTPQDNGHNTIK